MDIWMVLLLWTFVSRPCVVTCYVYGHELCCTDILSRACSGEHSCLKISSCHTFHLLQSSSCHQRSPRLCPASHWDPSWAILTECRPSPAGHPINQVETASQRPCGIIPVEFIPCPLLFTGVWPVWCSESSHHIHPPLSFYMCFFQ